MSIKYFPYKGVQFFIKQKRHGFMSKVETPVLHSMILIKIGDILHHIDSRSATKRMQSIHSSVFYNSNGDRNRFGNKS